MQFYPEYLAQFPDRTEIEVQKLAAEYHERTEAYDRTVCTGPILRGRIVPANAVEHSIIQQHAIGIRRELIERASRIGIGRNELHNAICNYRIR